MNSESSLESVHIDKIRASREGHTYHDIWTARVALELLVPNTNLIAVAVEGFSTEDAPIASARATEIADLVRYRGAANIFAASLVEVVQFKYSVAQALEAMRAADVRKTVEKFAKADGDFAAKIGRARVSGVVRYELVTNRPLHTNLLAAVDGITRRLPLAGDVANQADAIRSACNLPEDALIDFLGRLNLSGQSSQVSEVRASVQRTVANWGGAADTLARVRLSNLRELCREKAGAAGQNNNVIARVDVLAALEVAHEDELFPTPNAFPAVGDTIHRPIVDTIAQKILEHGPPILVHSPGGMGKTVVMQALARLFDRGDNAVVLFDCFGAGRWRDPADGRHMVQRALPHIANLLAGRGLCDVLLPGGGTVDLARAFRSRLVQAVEAMRAVDPGARVILLLDAIDHSALQAAETHTDAFSHVILKSLSISPIDGVSVAASCRTERRDIARNGAECREVPIAPFSRDETTEIVRLRDQTTTDAEVAALYTRSGGNPRVLDALIRAGRPYDDVTTVGKETASRTDLLDDLLERIISAASHEAVTRGLSQGEVDALLAGLALLPPPVPLAELAAAHARPEAAIESFAADLFPLIDRTAHGLIFRDEPTETLIRRLFKNDEASRKAVIDRLEDRQAHSSYAARALPVVLTSLGRTDDLIKLAFDQRLPQSATSQVAQRAIRLSRLAAALLACSRERRTDDLTELLLEAARVAGGHERSDSFLREHPDLVAISGDPEAVRRLFEVKSGWPGSRHAALAVLHALSDEPGEARRNARRALAWLDWRSRQPEDPYNPRRRLSTDELDLVGPAYVEALAGNATRVVNWLDQWPEPYAYRLYSQQVQLLENFAELSTENRALRDSIVRRAGRCRSKSRALPAALLQHADLSPDDARKVVRRLAAISPLFTSVPGEFDYGRRNHGIADALVTAAMRAIRLGQDGEARKIVDGMGAHRLRLHRFSSLWPNSNEIVRFFLAAAVRAALERRAPHLMDIAPEEVYAAVRLRKRSPSSEDYEEAIKRLVQSPPQGRHRRRKARKAPLGYREREEAARALQYRIRPLLPFVSAVAQLLRASDADTEVEGTLVRLAEVVRDTETYPYRDGPQYIARTALGISLGAANALGALSGANGDRLVDWLVKSPIQHSDLWTDVVSVLSRRAETRSAALILAERTGILVRSDTNINDRITANGALARAIWRTSRAEAQAYFRKGLDIADAIGSDDYSRATDLIEFAASYSGAPLETTTVYTFARICELTLYDEDKFPWTNLGEALARLGGAQALAIVARLADREKASLSLSLPPLLTSLVRHGRLDSDLAVGLIGLDDPVETWTWRLADFADAVVPITAPAAREKAVSFLLCEIDRRYQGTPRRDTLQRLLALCRVQLPPRSPVLQQLEALVGAEDPSASATASTARTPPVPEMDPWEVRVAGAVDPFDATAIDAALASADTKRVGRPVRVLSKLAERVQGVDNQLRFLRAVADAKIPTLADKLLAIEDHVKTWQEQSAAVTDRIPALASELSLRHADELVRSEWESSYALGKLIEFSKGASLVIISSVIEAIRGRATDVSGDAWMNFACAVARSASPNAIHSALGRFTSASAVDLPEEVGDGSWRTDLAAPAAPLDIVAGLLWLRLGSPIAADRWRAAHAMRRLCEVGRTDIIYALIPRFTTEHAGPFQDRRLPFFFLHARFWFLVALARIAKDYPDSVLPFRSLLEGIAFSDATPHVGMVHFAAQALLAVVGHLPAAEAAVLRGRLETVNASPFRRAREKKTRKDFYHFSRGEEENPFFFDYDFSKSEIDGLASAFGVDHSEAVTLVTGYLRQWSNNAKNMWECPRHPDDAEYRAWSGANRGRDTWGGHLAWHALMVAAGALLQRRPVVSSSYIGDRWREWLCDYTLSRDDGFWLADATDPFPPDLYGRTVSPGTTEGVPADPNKLAWLAGIIGRETLAEDLTIHGLWNSKEGLGVSIDSILVEATLALSVSFAVLTADPFDRWFPQERELPRRDFPLRRMFREAEDRERKLDGKDPYAAPTALRRPIPARLTTKILELRSADPFGRDWRNSRDVEVIRADAWGVQRESRGENGGLSGNRLRARVDCLLAFLTSARKCLVLLVKVQRHLKDEGTASARRRRNRKRFIPFQTQTLVAVVSPEKGVRVVRRVPKAAREAVKRMPDGDRRDFVARLQTIMRTQSAE